jgi:hypothetical protein
MNTGKKKNRPEKKGGRTQASSSAGHLNQELIDNLDFPVFSVDRHFLYTGFNLEHAAIMKSLFNADIQIGKSILDYHSVVKDRDIARGNLERALSGETVTATAHSGDEALSRHCFEVVHKPIRDRSGKITGVSVLEIPHPLGQRQRGDSRSAGRPL